MPDKLPESRSTATRIAGFGTNVLATGLILILGAVGGQQALRWWSAARPTPSATSLTDVAGPAVARRRRTQTGSESPPIRHWISFGDDALSAVRTELSGDTESVLARLRNDCRKVADQTTRVRREPGPAEQQLLAQIREQQPIESGNHWRMYQVVSPVPMVVAVVEQSVKAAQASSATRPASQPTPLRVTDGAGGSTNVAPLESRVVSWGLAFPAVADKEAPSDRWTLFTLTAEASQLGPIAHQRALPVPPQSQRTMSLQAESGATMVAFRGTSTVQSWRSYYDQQLAEPKWRPTSRWRNDGTIWQRAYASPSDGRLDVQLIEDVDGTLNGLLISAPPRRAAPEK